MVRLIISAIINFGGDLLFRQHGILAALFAKQAGRQGRACGWPDVCSGGGDVWSDKRRMVGCHAMVRGYNGGFRCLSSFHLLILDRVKKRR